MLLKSLISAIADFINGESDFSFGNLFEFMFDNLFGSIYDIIHEFFSRSSDFFINIGNSFTGIFVRNYSFFTEHFFALLVGLILSIYLLKLIIGAVIELISKFIDPM